MKTNCKLHCLNVCSLVHQHFPTHFLVTAENRVNFACVFSKKIKRFHCVWQYKRAKKEHSSMALDGTWSCTLDSLFGFRGSATHQPFQLCELFELGAFIVTHVHVSMLVFAHSFIRQKLLTARPTTAALTNQWRVQWRRQLSDHWRQRISRIRTSNRKWSWSSRSYSHSFWRHPTTLVLLLRVLRFCLHMTVFGGTVIMLFRLARDSNILSSHWGIASSMSPFFEVFNKFGICETWQTFRWIDGAIVEAFGTTW